MPKDHTNLAAVAPLTPRMIRSIETVVPRTELLETLAKMQIPFPRQLPDVTADDAFPTDVTNVGARELRALQSYWAAQYSRANALLGLARGEMKAQDRVVDREKLKLFRVYAQPKTLKDTTLGRVLASKRIAALERDLDNLIRIEAALDALVKDFSMYVSVIERELMYRMSEMKNNRTGGP